MATVDETHVFIKQFITAAGIDPATVFNSENNAYYLNKGSAPVEIFVSTHPQQDGTSRSFLRVFAKVADTPAANREYFYRRLLELNDASLGVKLTIMPGSDKVYATFERDINGIDANETATCINDLGLWADHLDDVLRHEFNLVNDTGSQAPKG